LPIHAAARSTHSIADALRSSRTNDAHVVTRSTGTRYASIRTRRGRVDVITYVTGRTSRIRAVRASERRSALINRLAGRADRRRRTDFQVETVETHGALRIGLVSAGYDTVATVHTSTNAATRGVDFRSSRTIVFSWGKELSLATKTGSTSGIVSERLSIAGRINKLSGGAEARSAGIRSSIISLLEIKTDVTLGTTRNGRVGTINLRDAVCNRSTRGTFGWRSRIQPITRETIVAF